MKLSILHYYVGLALPTVSAKPLAERQMFSTDPGISPYCSYWHDTWEGDTCDFILTSYGLSLENFRRWNPVIDASCSNVQPSHSYCIEVQNEPAPTSSNPATSNVPSVTQAPTPTTTSGGNGVTTPLPTQSGMTQSCRRFYYVQKGNTCEAIGSAAGVSTSDLYKWNPAIKQDCTGLWADTYICIGETDGPSVTMPPTPTTTQLPSTETATPFPAIPFPTGNEQVIPCHLFEWVSRGDSCDSITTAAGVASADFYFWNPSINRDCSNLQANSFVCIRGDPRPSTTTKPAGNGVATPTPIQTGMVNNCKTFYKVQKGDTCDTIAKSKGITVANFVRWNPAVRSDCTGMWADTWACVGL